MALQVRAPRVVLRAVEGSDWRQALDVAGCVPSAQRAILLKNLVAPYPEVHVFDTTDATAGAGPEFFLNDLFQPRDERCRDPGFPLLPLSSLALGLGRILLHLRRSLRRAASQQLQGACQRLPELIHHPVERGLPVHGHENVLNANRRSRVRRVPFVDNAALSDLSDGVTTKDAALRVDHHAKLLLYIRACDGRLKDALVNSLLPV
mmetsp:Transcript_57885/g.161559  ORF Transcript_57885/g.161559 Transcript_57885/m.161559 type:complete len:206 (-) Transcript_57885:322-939(-)